MKKASTFVFLVGIALVLVNCTGGEKKNEAKVATSKLPTLTMLDSATYDFGNINEGDVVEHTFNFRNDGVYPLIINNITSSCGCTTPEWPKDAVASKTVSSIKVRFDTKHKAGPQAKTITVYANTEPSNHDLQLKGMVTAAPKPEATK